MTIAYTLGNSLYLNLTNECSCDCTFCLRNASEGINPGESLWLEREPSLSEIIQALKAADFAKYEEVVFCGYGEPTMRLEVLIDCARFLKEQKSPPIRLNTNGLSDLVHGKKTAPLLEGLIDRVNISLNTTDAESYNSLCRPRFGLASFDAMLDFAKDCKSYIPVVVFSIVEASINEEALEKCRQICINLDIPLRLR